MIIWLVGGSTGSSDDYHSYAVKAFTSEDEAHKWVEEISSTVNTAALSELQELRFKYYDDIYAVGQERDYTDVDVDALYEAADKRALQIVQEKYPNADLTLDAEFNGYYVNKNPIVLVGVL